MVVFVAHLELHAIFPGNIFVVGTENNAGVGTFSWIVRTGSIYTNEWATVDVVEKVSASSIFNYGHSITCNPNPGSGEFMIAHTGLFFSGTGKFGAVRTSPSGRSGTFSYADIFNVASSAQLTEYGTQVATLFSKSLPFQNPTVAQNTGSLIVTYVSGGSYIVRKGTSTGTFATHMSLSSSFYNDPFINSNEIPSRISFLNTSYTNNAVYIGMPISASTGTGSYAMLFSPMFTSQTFSSVPVPPLYGIENMTKPREFISKDQDLFFIANDHAKLIGRLYGGKRTANSASIGPTTFNSCIGYVYEETSSSFREKFDLGNVSEFPHSSGLFQMKNMLLGTSTSGKFGTSQDSIIQIKHVGSTVKIMWPRQVNADSSLKTYGDLSPGQSPGKLTNVFDAGDFFEVTEFDHMALYCYLRKEMSGTLDDVVIQVERKPINNIGFTTEQAVSYVTSGSTVEARLRDIQYKKEINYGDLSLREIGWPIDIPLTNTKQIRISAKHSIGQIDDVNKNFIIYARFIKGDGTKTET